MFKLIVSALIGSTAAGGCPARTDIQSDAVKKAFDMKHLPGTYYEVAYHDATQPAPVCGCQRIVRTWNETKEVPCRKPPMTAIPRTEPAPAPQDNNSCLEGSILGGISGGAAGGVLSTQENWIWSIPLGIVGGSMIGCQIDGG